MPRGRANRLDTWIQSLVLMPQARRKHQPRAASNNTNPPVSTNAVQIQWLDWESSNPVIISATPNTARRIRPAPLMFGLKNLAIPIHSTAAKKHQKPNTKIQKNTKHQSPKTPTGRPSDVSRGVAVPRLLKEIIRRLVFIQPPGD